MLVGKNDFQSTLNDIKLDVVNSKSTPKTLQLGSAKMKNKCVAGTCPWDLAEFQTEEKQLVANVVRLISTFHPLGSSVTRKSKGGSTVEALRSRQQQSRGLNGGILQTQRLRRAVEAKAVVAMVIKERLPSDKELPHNIQMKCHNDRNGLPMIKRGFIVDHWLQINS